MLKMLKIDFFLAPKSRSKRPNQYLAASESFLAVGGG